MKKYFYISIILVIFSQAVFAQSSKILELQRKLRQQEKLLKDLKETVDLLLDKQHLPIPVGTICAYYGKKAPRGWLPCDGRKIDTVEKNSKYKDLVKHLRNMKRKGSKSNEAKVPDLQKYFLRGWSKNREVGTKQGDQIKSHTHNGRTRTDGGHEHKGNTVVNGLKNNVGRFSSKHYVAGDLVKGRNRVCDSVFIPKSGRHFHILQIQPTGGKETRPINIAVMYIIKY